VSFLTLRVVLSLLRVCEARGQLDATGRVRVSVRVSVVVLRDELRAVAFVVFVFSLCSDCAVRHVFPVILEGQGLGHGCGQRPGRRREKRSGGEAVGSDRRDVRSAQPLLLKCRRGKLR